jgi:hypothetical protein
VNDFTFGYLQDWLDEATKTILQFWRRKNAQRHGCVMSD